MSASVQSTRLPAIDDPWRRLPLLIPAALLTWALLLFGFSVALMQTAAPEPELKPMEARIVEIPVGGLQAGPKEEAAKSAPAAPHLPPVVKLKHHAPPKMIVPLAPVPSSPEGTMKSSEAPASGNERPGGATESGAGEGGSGGGSALGGIGTDVSGARAIYAPVPVIPDDLREEAFQTEAVASFKVSYEGDVEVTLVKPTTNPRLNQILLDTLRQWKFFPAMHDGVAVDSRFNVRIPVSVQ